MLWDVFHPAATSSTRSPHGRSSRKSGEPGLGRREFHPWFPPTRVMFLNLLVSIHDTATTAAAITTACLAFYLPPTSIYAKGPIQQLVPPPGHGCCKAMPIGERASTIRSRSMSQTRPMAPSHIYLYWGGCFGVNVGVYSMHGTDALGVWVPLFTSIRLTSAHSPYNGSAWPSLANEELSW